MRDRIPLLMRAGLVRPTLRNSMQPAAANLSSRLASAHELEADAAQRVTTHAAVVDAEGDTLYSDPVLHVTVHVTSSDAVYANGKPITDEARRQSRLSREQVQR